MDTLAMLGQQLQQARKRKGLSQTEVGMALETDRFTVSKWENGKQEVRLQTLQRLADLYDVSLDELIGAPAGVLQGAGGGSAARKGVADVVTEGLDPSERLMRLAEELSAALRMREENERLRIEHVEAPRAEAEKIAREAEKAAREAEKAGREAEKAAREAERVGQENLRMLMMQLMGTPRGSSQPGGGEPVDEAASTTEEKVDAARG